MTSSFPPVLRPSSSRRPQINSKEPAKTERNHSPFLKIETASGKVTLTAALFKLTLKASRKVSVSSTTFFHSTLRFSTPIPYPSI